MMASPLSSNTLAPLPLAGCRGVSPVVALGHSLALIRWSDAVSAPPTPGWMLVRLLTAPTDPSSDDTVSIRFRPSITLRLQGDDSCESPWSTLPRDLIRTVHPLTATTVHCDSMGHVEYRAQLNSSGTPLDKASTGSVAVASTSWGLALVERPPVPAVAMVVSYRSQRDVLWQTCLKRQLVGCPVVWCTKDVGSITTEIHVTLEGHVTTLTVESVTSTLNPWRTHVDSEIVVALIVPSTRITLSPIPLDASCRRPSHARVDHPTAVTLSSTARMLVDTIHCLQRIMAHSTTHQSVGRLDIPRVLVLSGPSGVGKTHAVRTAVAAVGDTSCHLVVVSGGSMSGSNSNSAAHALEQRWIQGVAPASHESDTRVTVLFLDECDALLVAPDETGAGATSLMVATVSRLLDRLGTDPDWRHVVVIAATNRVDALPASLRRPGRLDRDVVLAPPPAVERRHLLSSLVRLVWPPDAMVDDALVDMAEATVGYVAADLSALVRRAWLLYSIQHPTTAHVDLTALLRRAMLDVGASALRDAAFSAPASRSTSSPWDAIAGDAGGAKTALRQAIEWPRTKHVAYQQLGLAAPRGILLHGPPGCAKTTLARAAASASVGVAFLSLSPADVYASSYVGEAEGVVRRAFTLARSAAPCVLFFDEIDSILGSEDNRHCGGLGRSTSTSAEARVLSTFLNEMDGVDGSLTDGVLVLGATNRPGTLDAALLRPGRFDKIIYVPPPDWEGRRSILSMQCQPWPCRVDIDRLADHSVTGRMTGAELVGACREAAVRWLRDVSPSVPLSHTDTNDLLETYLEASLRKVKPLLSDASVLAEYTQFDERRNNH